MENERDYIQDIAEIRSMMERSSKFLSLSGWAGIMAGLYALAGAYVASNIYQFSPDRITYNVSLPAGLTEIILLGFAVLIFAIGTAVVLSYRKARSRGEQVWNTTSKRMVIHMSVPLAAGGIFMVILLSKNLIGLLAPASLVFYGLALYNAGNFTYSEIKYLGIIQVCLGLISTYFIDYSLMLWSLGFGVVHIVYGIVMHFKYER